MLHQQQEAGDHSHSHVHEIETAGKLSTWLLRVIAGAAIAAIVTFLVVEFLNSQGGRRAGLPADAAALERATAWIGVLWSDDLNQVTLLREGLSSAIARVDGLEGGPIELLISDETGSRIYAHIKCVEHGGITGKARLDLLPDNRIQLLADFVDGRQKQIFFRPLKRKD